MPPGDDAGWRRQHQSVSARRFLGRHWRREIAMPRYDAEIFAISSADISLIYAILREIPDERRFRAAARAVICSRISMGRMTHARIEQRCGYHFMLIALPFHFAARAALSAEATILRCISVRDECRHTLRLAMLASLMRSRRR